MKLPPSLDGQMFFSVDDAVRISRHGRTLVYEHIKRGLLAVIKSGSKTLIPRNALLRWIKLLMGGGAARGASSSGTSASNVPQANREPMLLNERDHRNIGRDKPLSVGLKMLKPMRTTAALRVPAKKKRSNLIMLAQTAGNTARPTMTPNLVKKSNAAKKRKAADSG